MVWVAGAAAIAKCSKSEQWRPHLVGACINLQAIHVYAPASLASQATFSEHELLLLHASLFRLGRVRVTAGIELP